MQPQRATKTEANKKIKDFVKKTHPRRKSPTNSQQSLEEQEALAKLTSLQDLSAEKLEDETFPENLTLESSSDESIEDLATNLSKANFFVPRAGTSASSTFINIDNLDNQLTPNVSQDQINPDTSLSLLTSSITETQIINNSSTGGPDPPKFKPKMALFNRAIKLLPRFEGTYDDVARFIRAVDLAMTNDEELSKPENVEIKQKLLDYTILNQIDKKTYDKIKDKKITSVKELHNAMREEFLKSYEPESILTRMNATRQFPNESVDAYAGRIKAIWDQYVDAVGTLDPTQVEQITAHYKKLAIKAFIRGCHPELRDLLLARDWESLDDAINWAIKRDITLRQIKLEEGFGNMRLNNKKSTVPQNFNQSFRNQSPRDRNVTSQHPRTFQNRYQGNFYHSTPMRPGPSFNRFSNNQGGERNFDRRNFDASYQNQGGFSRQPQQNHYDRQNSRFNGDSQGNRNFNQGGLPPQPSNGSQQSAQNQVHVENEVRNANPYRLNASDKPDQNGGQRKSVSFFTNNYNKSNNSKN